MGDINYLEFNLSEGSKETYFVGYLGSDGVGDIAFNIPRNGNSVFIGLAKKDPKLTAIVLSNLEDYECETARKLRIGDVIIIPKGRESYGVKLFGVILIRTATYSGCSKIPDWATIDGVETSFFLTVPITKGEYEIRNHLGHDALMDTFASNEKDISL